MLYKNYIYCYLIKKHIYPSSSNKCITNHREKTMITLARKYHKKYYIYHFKTRLEVHINCKNINSCHVLTWPSEMSALSTGISWDATAASRCSQAAVCTGRGSHNLCRPCWSTRPGSTNTSCYMTAHIKAMPGLAQAVLEHPPWWHKHNMSAHTRAMPGIAFRGVRSQLRTNFYLGNVHFHTPRI